MKQDTATKVAYKKTPDGDVYITSEDAFNEKLKEATEAKEALPIQVAMGTFGYQYAETVDEAVTLSGGNGVGEYENIEVFLGVYNYGAALRQHGAAKEILLSDNFEAWEGTRDVSFAISQKVERAKMSPEEKALKDLAKGGIVITAEALRAFIAQHQAAAASATA